MKPICISDGKTLKYFICGVSEKTSDDCEEYTFSGIETIAEKAFRAPCNLKRVFFDNSLSVIKKEAFKGAGELEVFYCGNKEFEFLKSDKSDEGTKLSIETLAFAECKNLHTVILSKEGTLTIEKNAFAGCSSLRTIVVRADKIKFTENPFEDCPQELVFVCSKDSEVEQFARENGYRIVNV